VDESNGYCYIQECENEVCACICVCIHVCVHMCGCTIHTYVCMYACINVCMYACMYVCMYVNQDSPVVSYKAKKKHHACAQ